MDFKNDKAKVFTLSRHLNALREFGEKIGIPTESEGDFKEIRSRYCGEKVLQLINEAIGSITPSAQTMETKKTDAIITSGRAIEVEFKFREFSLSDVKWKDCEISPDKAEHLFNVGGWLVAVWDDGFFCLWDCEEYQPEQNEHFTSHKYKSSTFNANFKNHNTAERMYRFDCDKALYQGNISKKCRYIQTLTNN